MIRSAHLIKQGRIDSGSLEADAPLQRALTVSEAVVSACHERVRHGHHLDGLVRSVIAATHPVTQLLLETAGIHFLPDHGALLQSTSRVICMIEGAVLVEAFGFRIVVVATGSPSLFAPRQTTPRHREHVTILTVRRSQLRRSAIKLIIHFGLILFFKQLYLCFA